MALREAGRMNHPHLVGSHRQGSAMRWIADDETVSIRPWALSRMTASISDVPCRPEVPQPPEDLGHGTRVLS